MPIAPGLPKVNEAVIKNVALPGMHPLPVVHPIDSATTAINAKYAALGGAKGFLGVNETPVTVCPDKVGHFQHFKGGSIYWHPQTGAHEVQGLIRGKWAEMGWERSFLGYPTSDETTGKDPAGAGRFSLFQNGAIYWAPSADNGKPHEVHGDILQRYLALGAEGSVLGYPVTDATLTPDRQGWFNHFQAGSIYWTGHTGAHEVHGLIRDFWAAHGWERNPALGYPISDELVPDRAIGFAHPDTARKPIAGLPADVMKVPAEAVSAGFPKAAANLQSAASPKKGSNRFTDFENGVVFWRRGDTAAQQLQPLAATSGGRKTHLTATEAVEKLMAPLNPLLARVGNLQHTTSSFAGTTAYEFDGTQVQNRRHKVNVAFQAQTQVGIVPMKSQATVELDFLVAYEPAQQKVTAYLTNWNITQTFGPAAGDIAAVRNILDPRLWSKNDLFDTENATVLSVKTMSNGDLCLFVEP